jgi:hypothetical protein
VTDAQDPQAPDPQDDPVLARRAQIATWVSLGQRVGYALFAVAMLAFFVGLVLDFTSGLVTLIMFSIVVGSLILAPAIVFGYGVKAAEREDREREQEAKGDTP